MHRRKGGLCLDQLLVPRKAWDLAHAGEDWLAPQEQDATCTSQTRIMRPTLPSCSARSRYDPRAYRRMKSLANEYGPTLDLRQSRLISCKVCWRRSLLLSTKNLFGNSCKIQQLKRPRVEVLGSPSAIHLTIRTAFIQYHNRDKRQHVLP